MLSPAIESVIKPKRPIGPGWVQAQVALSDLPAILHLNPPETWIHKDGFTVMTAVEKPDAQPGEADLGPEYHVSISRNGWRCTSADAMWVLGQFDVADAKEDNHVPGGFVRHFLRPVADHLSGYECPCQDSEPAIREDKGDFVWRGVPR